MRTHSRLPWASGELPAGFTHDQTRLPSRLSPILVMPNQVLSEGLMTLLQGPHTEQDHHHGGRHGSTQAGDFPGGLELHIGVSLAM